MLHQTELDPGTNQIARLATDLDACRYNLHGHVVLSYGIAMQWCGIRRANLFLAQARRGSLTNLWVAYGIGLKPSIYMQADFRNSRLQECEG